MNQIFLGAFIPFVLLALLYLLRRGRASFLFLLSAPAWLIAGALWAIAPDIPRVIGLRGLYNRLAQDPRTNIFFWHYTIDQLEGDAFPYHIPLTVMALLLLAAAWREVLLREERP